MVCALETNPKGLEYQNAEYLQFLSQGVQILHYKGIRSRKAHCSPKPLTRRHLDPLGVSRIAITVWGLCFIFGYLDR